MKSTENHFIVLKTKEDEMRALLVLSTLGYRWRGEESMSKPLATVSYKEAIIFIHRSTLTYTELSRGNLDHRNYKLMSLEDLMKY